MRGIFSLVGLLVVLAIVGLLAKKQLSATTAPIIAPNVSGVDMPVTTPGATVQQQSQQIQQQVKEKVEAAMQQAQEAKQMPEGQ